MLFSAHESSNKHTGFMFEKENSQTFGQVWTFSKIYEGSGIIMSQLGEKQRLMRHWTREK